jgi:hypothetical protein
MLTKQEIALKIRGAFLPFRCVIQFWDYSPKLRVKVLSDSRNGILEISKIPLRQAQDARQLEVLLRQVRQRVRDRGYALKNA